MERIIDTNVLIRFIVRDDENLYKNAVKEIKDNYFYVPLIIQFETVFVLERVYKLSRGKISVLRELFMNDVFRLEDEDIFFGTLDIYLQKNNLSFADSMLIAISKKENLNILTFDKALRKEIGKK